MKLLWRANQAHSSSDAQNADIVIAVIGMTGAGKSSFIASVTGREDIQVGHDLYSGTVNTVTYS
jgi:putative ribosome biogenesis GTPase RsgA